MDKNKELIKFYTEVMKLLTVLLAETLGSSISLILNRPVSASGVVFISFGLLMSVVFGYFIFTLSKTIINLINGFL